MGVVLPEGPDRAEIALTFEFEEGSLSPARAALLLVDLQALFGASADDPTWTGLRFTGSTKPAYRLRDALPRRRKPRPGQPYIQATVALEDVAESVLRVRTLDYGSPFHVLLEIPWQAYVTTGGGFIAALGVLFGAPHKAAAQFHKHRQEYWDNRLAADQAKANYAFHRGHENRDVRYARLMEAAAKAEDPPLTHDDPLAPLRRCGTSSARSRWRS